MQGEKHTNCPVQGHLPRSCEIVCASNLKITLMSLWDVRQVQPTQFIPAVLFEGACESVLFSRSAFWTQISQILHLPLFGSHCCGISEVTVRTPFCGAKLGKKSHRTGQHFLTRNRHSEQDNGRAGLEIGQTISPFLSNQ